jgi:hypothetical protein
MSDKRRVHAVLAFLNDSRNRSRPLDPRTNGRHAGLPSCREGSSVALAAPLRRLGHIAAVLHDGVRGYAAVSPVEPPSSVRTIRRACRLAGGDAECPAPPWLAPSCARGDLRSRWVVEQSVARCPPPVRVRSAARIEAPRGIRSGHGPHAHRRPPRGL